MINKEITQITFSLGPESIGLREFDEHGLPILDLARYGTCCQLVTFIGHQMQGKVSTNKNKKQK